MNWFKRILIKILPNTKICSHCGSLRMEHGSNWIGGYNHLCKQASSRRGTRCYDCGAYVWDETFEEYKKHEPTWCEPYKTKYDIVK